MDRAARGRNGNEDRQPGGQGDVSRFSPDGKSIAFIGNYDGGKDIYTLALDGAGIAQRLTYHPAMEFARTGLKDNQIVFFANGLAGLARQQQLFKVDANGGLPEQLPVPYGANGTISADGEWPRIRRTSATSDLEAVPGRGRISGCSICVTTRRGRSLTGRAPTRFRCGRAIRCTTCPMPDRITS
ncbi:MAG: hypothetical protein R3B46_03900 [Phycisphaerales bacterium]